MLVRFFTLITLPVFLSAVASATEPAAVRLEAVTGKVLVNQGKGFSAVTKSITLKTGSKIMLGQNSGAVLVFPASKTAAACKVQLAPVSMTSVTGRDMCSQPLTASKDLFENSRITPTSDEAGPGGIPPAAVGIGFFALAFGTGVVTLFDNKKTPVTVP
jgi:hypothetical protein